jgi:spore protease
MEAKTLWEESTEKTTKLQGVVAKERNINGIPVTEVEILDQEGEKALGKPIGRYITLELPPNEHDVRRLSIGVAQELKSLLTLPQNASVLVVGLGNEAVTPDAVGPHCISGLFLTRHLIENMPALFGSYRSVCALTPGVLGTTGIESADIVRGAIANVKPDCVLVIDALAARSAARIVRTVQMSDSGIIPGSGVGNSRVAFNKETLGVPVYSIGVPTVVDAATLVAELGGEVKNAKEARMFVTPRDIDAQIQFICAVLSGGINLALHPAMQFEDFAQFATAPLS